MFRSPGECIPESLTCKLTNKIEVKNKGNQKIKLKKKRSDCRLLLHRRHLEIHEKRVHRTERSFVFNHVQDLMAQCPPAHKKNVNVIVNPRKIVLSKLHLIWSGFRCETFKFFNKYSTTL